MPVNDIGIDMGTSNCVVYSTGKGIILKEPSIVAYAKEQQRIVAIGEEAKMMENHPSSNIEFIHPIQQGMIADYAVMEKMLKYFIQKAQGRRVFRKPRISVCVPTDMKEIEKRALEEATYQAGARQVYLIQQPMASAVGAGLDLSKPFGNMVVNIGGGATDVAVLSMMGIAASGTIKVAGENFNQAIVNYLRKNHSLFISQEQAETIKIAIGTAVKKSDTKVMEVKGRNLITGLPKTTKLTSEEVRVALHDQVTQILQLVHGIMERITPELAADIAERGILLTGGGALLDGMELAMEEYTGIHAVISEEPMLVTAVGTGKYAEVLADNGRMER